MSLNFAQAGGSGEPVEVPTDAPPQPDQASEAISPAAAMPLSFKSSRRLTLWTVIQALMRFSGCATDDALLRHGESNSLVSRREQGSAVNAFRDGLRFCEECHASASYYLAEHYRFWDLSRYGLRRWTAPPPECAGGLWTSKLWIRDQQPAS